eukprot:1150212-Pelagomonas_calceolata.AAC.2
MELAHLQLQPQLAAVRCLCDGTCAWHNVMLHVSCNQHIPPATATAWCDGKWNALTLCECCLPAAAAAAWCTAAAAQQWHRLSTAACSPAPMSEMQRPARGAWTQTGRPAMEAQQMMVEVQWPAPGAWTQTGLPKVRRAQLLLEGVPHKQEGVATSG